MGLKLAIKKKIIFSAFNKKKQQKPFNLEESELYELPKDSDWVKNNSYFFGGYDSKKKSSLVMRLGIRNLDYTEIFTFYKNDKYFLVTPEDYYPLDKTPITVNCIKPGEIWDVTFEGKLLDKKENKLHDVSLKYRFEARLPIYDFFYTIQNRYMIEATARCKWTKDFREETSKNDQRHYEQAGFLKGEIIIDGVKENLNMPAGRDHSFGNRNWDYMNDHIWLFAFNEKGQIFNYSLVNYPLLKNINCGYTDINKEKLTSVYKVLSLNYSANNGQGPDVLKLKLQFDDKSIVDVEATREDNHETHYQNGDYFFQEGLGEFLINGERAHGSIEYGFNKNPQRWEIKR